MGGFFGELLKIIYRYFMSFIQLGTSFFITFLFLKKIRICEGKLELVFKTGFYIITTLLAIVFSISLIDFPVKNFIQNKTGILLLVWKYIFALPFFTLSVCGIVWLVVKKWNVRVCTYTIWIMIACITQSILSKKTYIDGWVQSFYVLDYSLGFGSRMLIGTIMKFIFGDYITKKNSI